MWLVQNQEWEGEGEEESSSSRSRSSNALVAFASAGEAAALAEEGRAAVRAFVERYRLTTTTMAEEEVEEDWRYPWAPDRAAGAGEEGNSSSSSSSQRRRRVRVPRLLEHRFEAPLTLTLGGEGESVRVVLSGVLDRVDALLSSTTDAGEEEEEEEVRRWWWWGQFVSVCLCHQSSRDP